MDAQNNLEWLLLGMALSDMECLRRVNPEWWTNFKLRAIVEEVQTRLKERELKDDGKDPGEDTELRALTDVLRETGALAWHFEGTIPSVADAKERIEERVNVNSQFQKAWEMTCGMFGAFEWGMGRDGAMQSTEQKLEVISRVLGRESK